MKHGCCEYIIEYMDAELSEMYLDWQNPREFAVRDKLLMRFHKHPFAQTRKRKLPDTPEKMEEDD